MGSFLTSRCTAAMVTTRAYLIVGTLFAGANTTTRSRRPGFISAVRRELASVLQLALPWLRLRVWRWCYRPPSRPLQQSDRSPALRDGMSRVPWAKVSESGSSPWVLFHDRQCSEDQRGDGVKMIFRRLRTHIENEYKHLLFALGRLGSSLEFI